MTKHPLLAQDEMISLADQAEYAALLADLEIVALLAKLPEELKTAGSRSSQLPTSADTASLHTYPQAKKPAPRHWLKKT
jgi:hypothetical protein